MEKTGRKLDKVALLQCCASLSDHGEALMTDRQLPAEEMKPRKKIESEPCRCVDCGECNGSGSVWFAFGGKQYLGNSRCDDLDELETCEGCEGSGIVETCDRCQLLQEMDHDDFYP